MVAVAAEVAVAAATPNVSQVNDPKANKVDSIYVTWTALSGDGEIPQGKVFVRCWVERATAFTQLRHKSKRVITLTVKHYGEFVSAKIMGIMEDLYLKGFTKEQLLKFKASLAECRS